jgi:exodeoxyribonuclease VIII
MTTQTPDENEVYHADTRRIGKSGLDLIAKSPAHYWAKYLDPNREREEPTKAMLIGSAVHSAVLEPDDFARKYMILPELNLRTNAGKEKLEELSNHARANKLSIISKDDYELCKLMKETVWKHPAASVLLSDGIAEQRIDWTKEILSEDGEFIEVACKSKPDWQSHNGFIVDLKTTEDASPAGFAKSVWNYRYHVQAPFYADAYEHKYGEPPRGFIFIAVEKSPPYAVALYFAPPSMMDKGRSTYERDLRTYVKCLENGEWPAYGTEVMELQLPPWAK